MGNPLQLKSFNHISLKCRSLEKSLNFYQNVLGFFPIRRPGSFNFDGAWLFNYGIGIHLLQSEDPHTMPPHVDHINPKNNHVSFQCESMTEVEKRLLEMQIQYAKNRIEEGGIYVDQLFFHDPDGSMVEICNCENLPIVPLSKETVRTCSTVFSCNILKQQQQHRQTSQDMQKRKHQTASTTKAANPLPQYLASVHLNHCA